MQTSARFHSCRTCTLHIISWPNYSGKLDKLGIRFRYRRRSLHWHSIIQVNCLTSSCKMRSVIRVRINKPDLNDILVTEPGRLRTWRTATTASNTDSISSETQSPRNQSVPCMMQTMSVYARFIKIFSSSSVQFNIWFLKLSFLWP